MTPGDLGVLGALIGVAVRGAPPPETYCSLLQDIQDFALRWISAAYPSPTLDMVDAVAGGPISDHDAAASFASALLAPLNAQQRRLGPGLLMLASLLSQDLQVEFPWDESLVVSEEPREVPLPSTILLYSLNESALRRTSLALAKTMPDTKVVLSSAKVGCPQLREQVRGADMVVITTMCATHAATGFITESMAATARLVYPDGPGSGSLLRAIETELELG